MSIQDDDGKDRFSCQLLPDKTSAQETETVSAIKFQNKSEIHGVAIRIFFFIQGSYVIRDFFHGYNHT